MMWVSVSADRVAGLFRPTAGGRRTTGEESDCGQFLIVRYQAEHPLISDRFELWAVQGDGSLAPMSSSASPELAKANAERLRTTWLERVPAGGTA